LGIEAHPRSVTFLGEATGTEKTIDAEQAAFQLYSESLHACVIKVQSSYALEHLGESGELLSPKTAEEIIKEMVPFERAGRYIGTGDAEWGRIGWIASVYENVVITKYTVGPSRWYRRIDIEWKVSRCE